VGSTPTASALLPVWWNLVYTLRLERSGFGHAGSIPVAGTSWEPWVMRSLWFGTYSPLPCSLRTLNIAAVSSSKTCTEN
jgi:hypothetical protein